MTRELEAEATRLDRSVSWILQRAWLLARAHLRKTERPIRVGAHPPTSHDSPVDRAVPFGAIRFSSIVSPPRATNGICPPTAANAIFITGEGEHGLL